MNKHYCGVCRIEIAPSRTSVMFHEASKQHQEKVREALERSKNKGKGGPQSFANQAQQIFIIIQHKGASFQLKYERDQQLIGELKRIEEAAQKKFDSKDVSTGSYKSLQTKPDAPIQAKQTNPIDIDLGYKRPKNTSGGAGTYTLDDMRNEDKDPIWSAHYDEEQQATYYFNRKTKDSQWDRPHNFDGYEIMSGQGAVRDAGQREDYERTFGTKFAKASDLEGKEVNRVRENVPEDQGIIGGWIEEPEEEEEDYYKKHAITKLDPERAKELQDLDKDCRAKTLEEFQNQDSDEESDHIIGGYDSDPPELPRTLQGTSNLGKRQKPRSQQLVNATSKDLYLETLTDMKKEVEKGHVDYEDVRKDSYLPQNNTAVSFGFKKREAKGNVRKRRAAEVSDGETDL